MNNFLDTVEYATQENWCVQSVCTTCGSRQFRSAILDNHNLQEDLENIDLQRLARSSKYRDNWWVPLVIIIQELGNRIDWDRILTTWHQYAALNIRFADTVLYHLLYRAPCRAEIRIKWLDTCVELAVSIKDDSLVESLILKLRDKLANYPELIDTILQIYPDHHRTKSALVSSGYLAPEVEMFI